SGNRKSVNKPVKASLEWVLDDLHYQYQPSAPSNPDERAQLHQDEELNQLLARLKSKFAPPEPAYLQLQMKVESGMLSNEDDPYFVSSRAQQPDFADSVASVVEIESSPTAAIMAPTLNSTISRLANYLSDKHGGDFGNAGSNSQSVYRAAHDNGQPMEQQKQMSSQVLQNGRQQKALQQQFDYPQHVSVAAIKARLLSVDQEKRFSCYICQRRFHLFAHLRNHLETHTGEKRHECEQCGKCFATLTSLKRHVPIHHSDKKYRCSVCGKAYANQGYLKVHMRIHRDEKPFDCELCGRAFRQLAHLNHHLLTHTGDKPHKCDLCGQRFRQANTLDDHMRLHTGERPHCCPICGKSFTHRLSLKLHMKYHPSEAAASAILANHGRVSLQKRQNQQQRLMVEQSDDVVEIIAD
ncbi:hypothetical protein BOX15_Mlig023465g1, partial [Macrostomum lignano]